MIRNPRVGQVVRLNDHGIDMIGGLPSWEVAERARHCRIVEVRDDLHLTDAPDVVSIDVDVPFLFGMILTNQDFDLLEE